MPEKHTARAAKSPFKSYVLTKSGKAARGLPESLCPCNFLPLDKLLPNLGSAMTVWQQPDPPCVTMAILVLDNPQKELIYLM